MRGVALRVRCVWENTTQGRPRRPLAEFVELTVDGIDAVPVLVTKLAPGGAGRIDHYHPFHRYCRNDTGVCCWRGWVPRVPLGEPVSGAGKHGFPKRNPWHPPPFPQ